MVDFYNGGGHEIRFSTLSSDPGLTDPEKQALLNVLAIVIWNRGELEGHAVSLDGTGPQAHADAAHARLGTWRLNLQQSKIDPASPTTYKSETRIYTDAGADGVKVSITSVDAAGKTATRGYTAKYDGKDYPQVGNPNGDTIRIKEVDANTADSVTKKAGKVVLNSHSVLSKDGKTLTIASTGTDSKGQQYTNTLGYRQTVGHVPLMGRWCRLRSATTDDATNQTAVARADACWRLADCRLSVERTGEEHAPSGFSALLKGWREKFPGSPTGDKQLFPGHEIVAGRRWPNEDHTPAGSRGSNPGERCRRLVADSRPRRISIRSPQLRLTK